MGMRDRKTKPEPPCVWQRATAWVEVFSRFQKFKSSGTRGWGDLEATIRVINQEMSLPPAFSVATFIVQVKADV